MRRIVLVVALGVSSFRQPLTAQSSTASSSDLKPSVFVGPQLREGFVDVNTGIRDSILDIKREFQRMGFKLVMNRDEPATLALTVLARGIVTNGSVGFNSSSVVGGTGTGFGFVMPNTVPTITTVLRVAQYELRLQSEGPTWGRAASAVVDDVLAWWAANELVILSKK